MIKVAAFLLVALLAAYGLHALAQGRVDVRPAVTPIDSSSSNGLSYAWFYDASGRTVFVCRIGHGAGDTVECKAKAALP